MTNNFKECPFFLDEIQIFSIYRSLSPGNFFMTFKHQNVVSKPIMVETPYNQFNKFICGCETVWYPDFEEMKALLILGVKVKEPMTEDDRKEMLERKDDVLEFGTYDFNENCKYTVIDGKYTFKRKTYRIIINNVDKIIKIVHTNN